MVIDSLDPQESAFTVREILLLNKKSGLPILSRVYGEPSGKDPTLVAGLLAAIIQFAETIGNNLELNDIGIAHGSRIFVRIHSSLVCLLIIDNFHISMISETNFMDVINEISTRVFESFRMMFSMPSFDSLDTLDDPLESLDNLLKVPDRDPLDDLNEMTLSKYPEIGYIIDNIVFESTMMFKMAEEEVEEGIDKTLTSLEASDQTYLSPSYAGTTKKIKKEKSKVKDIFSRLNLIWEDQDE